MSFEPGEIGWADVPFVGSEGSKVRPVIVLHPTGDSVIVLCGTTKTKPQLQRIATIDKHTLPKDTHFYAENLRELPTDAIRSMAGRLSEADAARVVREMAVWIRNKRKK